MIKRVATALLAAAGTFAAASETVDSVDISKYIGRWYQVKQDKFNALFQGGTAYCATADYGLNTDGTVSVFNSQNTNAVNGTLDQIYGYAYIPDETEPGKLKVHLDGVPVDGDYWILELGPSTYSVENLYQYSIVSDRNSASLFVLARDVDYYYENYDTEVTLKLQELGFTSAMNKPQEVVHEGCTYAAPPAAVSAPAAGFDTVDELKTESYLGRWFQMYASPSVMNTFEKGCVCVTADYGLRSDGKISVHNVCAKDTPNGPLDIIDGYAYVPDASEPGQLKVHFDTNPVDAPYWVLALGPLNSNNEYDWSIVSDNFGSTLFVLARDVKEFQSKYEAEVLALVKELGFTRFYNKPIETLHEGCSYTVEP